jgi:hypothetical protein
MPGPGASRSTKKAVVSKDSSQQQTNQTSDQQGWSSGGIPTVTYITSSVPTAADPNFIEKKTEAQLNQELFNMSPAERIALANKLKASNYSVGPINGQATRLLRKAWLDAHADLQNEIAAGQQLDLNRYLSANQGLDGGSGAPFQRKIISSDTEAAGLINTVYEKLLGRKASDDELKQYTTTLQKAQEKSPLKYTDTAGAGYTQRGGLDANQFLIEQISQNDEAKANRVLQAYSAMMDVFGGLR